MEPYSTGSTPVGRILRQALVLAMRGLIVVALGGVVLMARLMPQRD